MVVRAQQQGLRLGLLLDRVQVAAERRCAKVSKDPVHRSFKQAAAYQEGRRVQNSRSARALSKRSAFGQSRR